MASVELINRASCSCAITIRSLREVMCRTKHTAADAVAGSYKSSKHLTANEVGCSGVSPVGQADLRGHSSLIDWQ